MTNQNSQKHLANSNAIQKNEPQHQRRNHTHNQSTVNHEERKKHDEHLHKHSTKK